MIYFFNALDHCGAVVMLISKSSFFRCNWRLCRYQQYRKIHFQFIIVNIKVLEYLQKLSTKSCGSRITIEENDVVLLIRVCKLKLIARGKW